MVGRNIFELFLSNLEQRRIETLVLRLTCRAPPPPTRKKSLGKRQMLCGFTDIFALLSS